jgi:FolB domain-containing protein
MASIPNPSQLPDRPQRDTIFIRNLSLHIPVGFDAWHQRGIPQPVVVSVRISYDVTAAAASDDVSQTLDYGKLCRSIASMASSTQEAGFRGPKEFAGAVSDVVLGMSAKGSGQVDVDVLLPKGVLSAVGGVRYRRRVHWMGGDGGSAQSAMEDEGSLAVEGCQCNCVVGVNAAERLQRQRVMLDWSVEGEGVGKALEVYQDATRVVIEVCRGRRAVAMTETRADSLQRIEGSSYQTVEALATLVARILTMDLGIESCTVSIMKPSALASVSSVDGAGVEITRRREFFSTSMFWPTGAARTDSNY